MADAPAGLAGALLRYRVMAIITGVLLIVVFVGMLRYLPAVTVPDSVDSALGVIAQVHGFVYIVYLAVCAHLWLKMRWGIGRAALLASGGVIPGIGFWIEHKVTTEVRDAYPATAAADAA